MFTTGMLLWWTKVDFNLIAAPWFWAPALHKERSLIHQSVLRRRLPPSCLSHSASQFGTFQKSAPEEEVRYPLNNRLYPKRHQQPLSAPFHQCFFALLCLEITVWQFVWRTSLWYFLSKCHKGCYQKKRYKAFKPLKGATCLTTVFFLFASTKKFFSFTHKNLKTKNFDQRVLCELCEELFKTSWWRDRSQPPRWWGTIWSTVKFFLAKVWKKMESKSTDYRIIEIKLK